MNRNFSKEDIQKAHRYMKKKWLISVTIRDMQIKTTMRYHFMPVRMAIITSDQGGGIGRYNLPPCTTKRKQQI